MYIEKNLQIHLKSRPVGLPAAENFSLVSTPIAMLKDGEVLVKNLWMSVDPYMRGRMIDRDSYIAPFAIDKVLEGGAIGEVVESNNPAFVVGAKVSSMNGWRQYFTTTGEDLQVLPETGIAEQAFLGVLGMPGLTAFTGLTKIAELKPSDRVFVSAASGAVGAIVCQIAKLKGCYVAGSVGSDAKSRYLMEELGVDAVVNYKTTDDLQQDIATACPEGIDVYFENVGGAHLEAVLNLMNANGRIAVCGMIDQYNATTPQPGPANLSQIVRKKLKMQGFIVFDHWDGYPAFVEQMVQWIQQGKVSWRETVFNGIEQAPEAFIGLFEGKNTGKMLVKL
ncbi:NADP-dependent oxidoreductase [Aestuariirhabdus litorea]|uniref:NADP-dependent oxidoreductase n=1 Tax=Aestuariirhabdus litorea TaxID=2528527 RepID=A0A3P3VKG0_9GAMM|nr:NADP-dependent oxidoreductase [Aestuariirhabdus litorea]RRJ82259.1 NADP-dependent oxidoreductase [Aestuariirhabdus litorea]RWW92426.1 NADP-dependent oxidoreductase [Endozoicomonadaceae bacterium GTF-13]